MKSRSCTVYSVRTTSILSILSDTLIGAVISIVVVDKKERKSRLLASFIQDLDSSTVGGLAIPNDDQYRLIASGGGIVHLPVDEIPFNEVPRVAAYPQPPPPIRISLGVDPKPFERFVHLPGYLQLANLRRQVTVLRDVVLYPERRCRPRIFSTARRSVGERRIETGS
jgi:hypothetical protein